MVYCSMCGKETEHINILDGKVVCDDCLNKTKHFLCDLCGEYHSTESRVVLGYVVCENCEQTKFVKCSDCGELLRKNIALLYRNDYLCRKCYEKREKYKVKGYHQDPIWVTYGEDKENTYGIELEVDRPRSNGDKNKFSEGVLKILGDGCYTMHDGSLQNGFEIITHPHDKEALLALPWKEAFEYLTEHTFRSDQTSTCGLHMHISRSQFTRESLAKMTYFYDKNYDTIINFARRTPSSASRWARSYYFHKIDNETDSEIIERIATYLDELQSNGYHNDRYHCVNVIKTNTIEIRIMKGTLNYETFLASLDFIMTIAKNAKTVTDLDDNTQWLQGLKPETIEYIKKRHCFTDVFNDEEGGE